MTPTVVHPAPARATAADFLARFASRAPRVAAAEPGWRQQERVEAEVWLHANGMPTRHDEPWKYTPLDKLWAFDPDLGTARDDGTEVAPAPSAPSLGSDQLDELAGVHGGARLVFVNGAVDATLSRAVTAAGVTIGPLSALSTDAPEAVRSAFEQVARRPRSARFDGFQALNLIHSPDAAVVWVDADTQVDEPIHLVHVSVASDGSDLSHPRSLVWAGPRSRFTVIESFVGYSGTRFVNAASTLTISADAHVTHHRVQAEGPGTVHIGHTAVTQAAGSAYHASSIMAGGDLARSWLDVVLAGDGSTADLQGIYVPSGAQHHDNIVTVEHAGSHTTSHERFKGVIDDAARGCFTGHVLVQPGTIAADASQTNQSMLLSRTAQSDTRPWLEILADDVKCTHGATVGRLDDHALFYLRARGIPESQARTMLVGAFIGEVLEAINVASLRHHLAATIGSAGGIEIEVPEADQ